MGKRKKISERLAELEFEYGRLLVSRLRHEKKMRKEAMRIEKKRKVSYVT